MTGFKKKNCRIWLTVLTLSLSGCLETLPLSTARSPSTSNPVLQEKVMAVPDRPAAPAFKPTQVETTVKAVAPRDTLRAEVKAPEVQSTKKLTPVVSLDKPPTGSSSKGKEISCSPAVVRPGDILAIKTNKSYPDFGVRVPDKNVKFIMLVTAAYPEGLMDSEKFGKQMGINVDVSEAKIKPNTRIFTKEGIYRFVVSRNLETDDGTPSFECSIRYIAK